MLTGLPGSSVTYGCDTWKNCEALRGRQRYPCSLQPGEAASFFTRASEGPAGQLPAQLPDPVPWLYHQHQPHVHPRSAHLLTKVSPTARAENQIPRGPGG